MNKLFALAAASIMALAPSVLSARQPAPATPSGNPGLWVTAADYPPASLGNGEHGVVEFLLEIMPDGTVGTCSIVVSSGFSALDLRACELLKVRAQFHPARDEKGLATTGTYQNRVRWVIPGKSPMIPHFRSIDFAESFIVETDGKVSNCVIERNSNDATSGLPNQQSVCGSGLESAPYRDSKGNPVRTRVRISRSIELTPPEDK